MLVVNLDVLIFSINTTLDIKDLALFVDDESTVKSKELPPSGVDTRSDSNVV